VRLTTALNDSMLLLVQATLKVKYTIQIASGYKTRFKTVTSYKTHYKTALPGALQYTFQLPKESLTIH